MAKVLASHRTWCAATSASPRRCRRCSASATRCGRCRRCSLASRPGLGRMVRHEPAGRGACRHAGRARGRRLLAVARCRLHRLFPLARARLRQPRRRSRRIKAANPRVLVLVDPILGDAGRLYVAPETAEAIRDELLPLATVATPNLFELQWLTGIGGADHRRRGAGSRRARAPPRSWSPRLPRPTTTVTTLLVTGRDADRAPAAASVPASPTAPATCSPGSCSATC